MDQVVIALVSVLQASQMRVHEGKGLAEMVDRLVHMLPSWTTGSCKRSGSFGE